MFRLPDDEFAHRQLVRSFNNPYGKTMKFVVADDVPVKEIAFETEGLRDGVKERVVVVFEGGTNHLDGARGVGLDRESDPLTEDNFVGAGFIHVYADPEEEGEEKERRFSWGSETFRDKLGRDRPKNHEAACEILSEVENVVTDWLNNVKK